MSHFELPADKTIEAFGSLTRMHELTGRPISTIASRLKSKTKRFPHWWTPALQAIAEQKGIELPKPLKAKPRAKKRRAA